MSTLLGEVQTGSQQLGDYNGKSTWMHNFNYEVLYGNSGGLSNAFVITPDSITIYQSSANGWIANSDITNQLIELKNVAGVRVGWQRNVINSGKTETYDVQGKLVSISDRAGLAQTMTYSCNIISTDCPVVTPTTVAPIAGLLISVTDNVGRKLNFSYDIYSRIKSMSSPNGVFSYAYDANGNLSSVTYPDSKVKTYLYENTSYVNALTGITDENGNRYSTWAYDSNGLATSNEQAGGVESYVLNYSQPNLQTTVTDPLGSVRTYNFTTILGVVKSTGQSQPGGSGCSAAASAITYDANGNVASRTDFDGHKTTYVYDMPRNLETSRIEGLTSAGASTTATRTITTTWHATWRLPLVTTEYTGGASATGVPTGTALHTTTHVYDTKGNVTSISEADPARALTRTTTITYTYSTVVPGLVMTKVVNGQRTDVTDTTTYSYYDANATCTPSAALPIVDPITGTSPANLGCRGQLQSTTNALGKTTQFNRYNHHGQVEQMTDANGVVTTNTYDLRQRLLSHKVGNETTSLTYDNVGQVTQLTMPDASTLNYSYDAAHRLTQIQDTVGNKVTYTLDAAGNRTNEVTTDPLGNLAKTLTRSYDALNRLQQMTGVQ